MYKAIYKCRLCGEIIEKDVKNISDVTTFAWYVSEGGNFNILPHACKDGSSGVADFCGYKKVGD